MLSVEAIRKSILQIPLCRKLPDSMRDRFAMILMWISAPRELSRGQRLYAQGDPGGREGCLLLEGMVEITRAGGQTKYVESPEILGEGSQFMKTMERTASVDVVVGGMELTFAWKDLGRWSVRVFTKEERQTLKRIIAETAWARSGDYLDYEPNEVV